MDFNKILQGAKTLGMGALTGGGMVMNLLAKPFGKANDPQEALYQSNQVPQQQNPAVNSSFLNSGGVKDITNRQPLNFQQNAVQAINDRINPQPRPGLLEEIQNLMVSKTSQPAVMGQTAQAPTPTAMPSSWSNIPQPAVPTPSPKPNATVDGFSGINIPGGVPNDFSGIMLQAAQDNGINPALLAALFYQEGKFNPKAFNPQNGSEDRGMAQISKKWHPEVTDAQAYDPNFAIPFAAKKLSSDIKSFDDISRGIAAYNVGRGGASVNGPEKFGGGPKGQQYIDLISQYLTPEAIQALGIKQNWKY